ncbi:hypothetical protein [Pseudonocardia xishanensis]|uniref:Copper(I)-binding protein n=1 Tax=Pseudonocardia xishanensis TaxID=630995 RepID=A0ABP8S390_9PSEU
MPTINARAGCAALLAVVLALAGCATSVPATTVPTTQSALPTSSDETATLTPVAIRPLSPQVHPVLGADGRIHLAYELQIINVTGGRVVLGSVSVLGDGDAVITTVQRADLLLRPAGGATGDGLGPGQAGDLFLDATLPADATPPQALRHTVALTMPDGAAKNLTFTGVQRGTVRVEVVIR